MPERVYCVFSYNRPQELARKTLPLLLRHGVAPERVRVYLGDHDGEADAYRAAAGDGWQFLPAPLGKPAALRHAHLQHPEGTELVCLDDDLCQLRELVGPRRAAACTRTMDEIADHGFGVCRRNGLRLWGLRQNDNALSMKPRVSCGLRFVVGTLHGCYAGDPAFTDLPLPGTPQIEDLEASLWHFVAHGGTARLDSIACRTKYLAPGGIVSQLAATGQGDRKGYHLRALLRLQALYPGLVSVFTDRNGYANFRLKPVLTHVEPPPG